MTLRAQIASDIHDELIDARDHGNLPWKYDMPDAEKMTDAILAKIREALLRDEAVEAGAKRMLGVQQNHGVGLTISEDYAWGVQFDDGREEARQEARAAITAALDAVTGEGDR